MNEDGFSLTLSIKATVQLIVQFQIPSKRKPNKVMSASL